MFVVALSVCMYQSNQLDNEVIKFTCKNLQVGGGKEKEPFFKISNLKRSLLKSSFF